MYKVSFWVNIARFAGFGEYLDHFTWANQNNVTVTYKQVKHLVMETFYIDIVSEHEGYPETAKRHIMNVLKDYENT